MSKKKLILSLSLLFVLFSFKDLDETEKPKINLTASYYSNIFNGRKCANGSKFHNSKLTAASNMFPLNTEVKVTNTLNGKFIIVKITDRINKKFTNKRIDLSKKAFASIGNIKTGLLNVLVEEFVKKES